MTKPIYNVKKADGLWELSADRQQTWTFYSQLELLWFAEEVLGIENPESLFRELVNDNQRPGNTPPCF